MNLCRFRDRQGHIRIGASRNGDDVLDLTSAGVTRIAQVLERDEPASFLKELVGKAGAPLDPSQVRLCAPVDEQEIWAAGVTYLRSKKARMDESQFSATAYDRVYEAERPELFFKSLPTKVSGLEEPVGIRKDSKWSVPEPELALVFNSSGRLVGYTIGNDMSARDIEGENLLYLPQAKIYQGSCALGPWITLGVTETEARQWTIRLRIGRNGQEVFSGETSVNNIKRRFEELGAFLFHSQSFSAGTVLLTGTGIVPPDSFTLRAGDIVEIGISGIGTLKNSVIEV